MIPDHIGRKARAVIETVVRNRVVPPAILHRLHFRDCSQNAVSQCTASLCEQGWLTSQRLVGTYRGLIPGRRVARALNLPPSYGKPLPRQTLQQNLGATLFCGLDQPKKRLLPNELRAEYPWLPASLANGRPFFFDHDRYGTRRLAVIRVELSASAYRIVEKHQRDLYKWNAIRPFRKLLDKDLVTIVTMTATQAAAQKVADHIRQSHAYPRARVMAWPRGCSESFSDTAA